MATDCPDGQDSDGESAEGIRGVDRTVAVPLASFKVEPVPQEDVEIRIKKAGDALKLGIYESHGMNTYVFLGPSEARELRDALGELVDRSED